MNKNLFQFSVIIPVYKNYQFFLKNLKRNYRFLSDCQLIVVNDYPAVKIRKMILHIYPSITVIDNERNLGFGESINQGVKMAKGKYLFLLNSDVIIQDFSFKKIIDLFRKNTRLFAVSLIQKEKNGKTVGANRGFFKDGLIYHQSRIFDQDKPSFNFWAEGGSTILRKDIFERLGGFDDLFSPFYWEDVDLSYRAWKAGYEIIFDPRVVVIHHHETTISRYFKKDTVRKIALRNQLLFFWKNVTDSSLWKNHFFHLLGYINQPGFFEAFFRLHKLISRRNKVLKLFKKTDKEILDLFQS
ncbi:MAG: glycosyltransferase [Patescibacteria group bacterium]|nr:glycosyltransferase [Patescibacteria group bacterium]